MIQNKNESNSGGDRGEKNFIKFPKPAAIVYNKMMNAKSTKRQINEIASFLSSIIKHGSLLDVGTGPGLLLKALNQLNPDFQLYGLDISENMKKIAKKNLNSIRVDLRVGKIQETDYLDNFFDLVTCTGSFYLWNQPERGLNEIFRILQNNKTAYLFETYSDYNKEDFKTKLKQNLSQENLFRRKFMPRFLKKQLDMTYSLEELNTIMSNSKFRFNYNINQIIISNLPIWVRIELKKVI